MKKIFVVFLLTLWLVFSSNAIFEPVFVGGRYVALGGANVTEVSDPYSIIYNPACIVYTEDISLSVSYSEPFGVAGANLINFNLTGNVLDLIQAGFTFSSYGSSVDVGLRYMVLGFGLARGIDLSDLVSFVDMISLGVVFKGLSMSLRGHEIDETVNGDKFGFSVDAGVNFSLMEDFIKLGVVGYNLLPYKFAFLSDFGGSEIYSSLKLGASLYLVKPYMKVFGAYNLGLNSSSTSYFSLGTEISYADTIFTRIGLDNNRITAGLGIKGPNFEINFGVQNRDNLGWYYQVDLIGFANLF
ncbi:MAG: hypothetical protein ACK4F9_02560 [Brevinematia bacterium]